MGLLSGLDRLTGGLVRFSVTSRVMIAAVAVAAPITGMTVFLLITGVNHDINFAEAERAGNRYQRPLELLLRQIPAHSLLSGDAKRAAEADIETAFTALEAVQAADGEGLQFTPAGLAQRKRDHLVIPELRKEWDALKRGAPSNDAYAHLVADFRGMIAHAGDTSNLILDPDLDSYYVMDITLLALPQTQDRLAQMLAAGHGMLSGTPTPEDRGRLAIFAAMLQEADHDRIAADVQTALNEDPNFGGVSPTLQARIQPALDEYSTATKAFVKLTNEAASGARAVTPQEYVQVGTRAREASFTLWNVSVDELDRLLDVRLAAFRQQRVTGLMLTAVALVLSGLLVLLIARSITGPLERTSDALAQTAVEIASASDQLASSAHALSAGSQQQAASLEETSGTMSEIASLAAGNADRSTSARDLMQRISTQTDESTRMLDQMVSGMDAIRGSSDGIARIIRTIDEIAFQTNVLSLNAAVEAARAGKAGAGFAVVADEVRGLAQRSADAAHETGTLIDESRVTATQGAEHVSQVVTSIASFIVELGKVRALIDEIDGASREQANGVRQVASGVEQVERGVQSASATAEETAAASEELAAQAAVARRYVEDLRTAIRGTRTDAARRAALDDGEAGRRSGQSAQGRRARHQPNAAPSASARVA